MDAEKLYELKGVIIARASAAIPVIRRIVGSIPGYADSMQFDLNVIEAKEIEVFIDIIETLLKDLPEMKISDAEKAELELALFDVSLWVRFLSIQQTNEYRILELIGRLKAKGKSEDN